MQDQDDNDRGESGGDVREGIGVGDDSNKISTVELPRRGNVEKCPVCGSRVDVEAYHCPACHNSFCFHCRARLLPPDTQLQCVNQQCDYYGKLVCEVCDSAAEKEEPPTVYAEPEDGYWPALLALVLILVPLVWYFTSSFLVAVGFAVLAFVGGGSFLQRRGVNVFGRENQVEHPRRSTYYTCIRCRQPVKKLHGG